jgi:hypothetical protein
MGRDAYFHVIKVTVDHAKTQEELDRKLRTLAGMSKETYDRRAHAQYIRILQDVQLCKTLKGRIGIVIELRPETERTPGKSILTDESNGQIEAAINRLRNSGGRPYCVVLLELGSDANNIFDVLERAGDAATRDKLIRVLTFRVAVLDLTCDSNIVRYFAARGMVFDVARLYVYGRDLAESEIDVSKCVRPNTRVYLRHAGCINGVSNSGLGWRPCYKVFLGGKPHATELPVEFCESNEILRQSLKNIQEAFPDDVLPTLSGTTPNYVGPVCEMAKKCCCNAKVFWEYPARGGERKLIVDIQSYYSGDGSRKPSDADIRTEFDSVRTLRDFLLDIKAGKVRSGVDSGPLKLESDVDIKVNGILVHVVKPDKE